MPDGNVTIKATLDASNVTKGVSEIKNSMQGLTSEAGKTSSGMVLVQREVP